MIWSRAPSSKSGVRGWTTSSWLRLLRRRCGSCSSVSCSSGSDGGRSDRNIERSGTDSWCRGQASRRWWTRVLWWMAWQCCGKKCWNLLGRRCVWTEMRDMRLRTDQLKRTNAWRNGELCVKGPPLDRGGSVVETFAQDWSPVNREVQHECVDRERVLCWAGHGARMDCSEICAKSLEMSRTAVVEMAPTFLERGKEKSNGQDRIQNGSNLQMGRKTMHRDRQTFLYTANPKQPHT